MGWLRPAERDRILAERDGDDALGEAERPVSSLRYLLGLRSVWGLFLTQGCEVYGGYMLLTWLPSYLQQAKGLSVLNAGMLTAVPFGAATVMAVLLGLLTVWYTDFFDALFVLNRTAVFGSIGFDAEFE